MEIARLREVLAYDPETGHLTWLVRTARRVQVGDRAGYVDKDGRVQVRIDGVLFKGARVAWALHHGQWPDGVIDHKDGNPGNDRADNLRDVPQLLNMQNQRKASGVRQRGRRWYARLAVDGKEISLGGYDTEADAKAAWRAAKRVHAACDY